MPDYHYIQAVTFTHPDVIGRTWADRHVIFPTSDKDDKRTFIYIELPKFRKMLDELNAQADKWLFSLRHLA